MAYTKKKKKVGAKPKRRRRMGAGKINIGETLGVAAGAIAGTYVINGPMESTSYVNIGAIVLGLIVPRFSNSAIVGGIGNGLVAAGMVSILQNANVISGMPMGRTVIASRRMGAQPLSSVAGGQRRRMGLNPAQVKTMTTVKQAGRTVLNGVPGRRPLSSVNGTNGFCDATV